MRRSLEPKAYKEDIKVLANLAKALGHLIGVSFLEHLENQSCCFIRDLVGVLAISQSTVLQHLKE
ncbi:hypothetical protein N8273_03550 [Algibacter sp.]|nr:hypothetical protein [Algibacter sp.]